MLPRVPPVTTYYWAIFLTRQYSIVVSSLYLALSQIIVVSPRSQRGSCSSTFAQRYHSCVISLLRVSATLAYPLREETQHFQITIQLLFPLASNIFVITSLVEFVSTTKPTKLRQNIHLDSPNYTKFPLNVHVFSLISIFLHMTEVWPKLGIIISTVSMWNSAILRVLTF